MEIELRTSTQEEAREVVAKVNGSGIMFDGYFKPIAIRTRVPNCDWSCEQVMINYRSEQEEIGGGQCPCPCGDPR